MLRSNHIVCGLAVCGLAASASAGPLVINLTHEYSGAAAPSGAAPWATATFTDNGDGTVTLTMDPKLNSVGEKLGPSNNSNGGGKGWFFNLDPTLNAASLALTHVSGLLPTYADHANDNFKADGDGDFDFTFGWTTGLSSVSANVVYTISLAGETLTPASFNYVSVNGPAGKNGFLSATHVQGITNPSSGTGGSGWIADIPVIPLPTSAGMAFAGLLGLGCVRRRRGL